MENSTNTNSSSLGIIHTSVLPFDSYLRTTTSTSSWSTHGYFTTSTVYKNTSNLTSVLPVYGLGLTATATHILVFFLVSLAIFAIIGNFTLMGMVVIVRKLHSKAHIFIVDLTISDILVALTVMPIDIDKLMRNGFLYNTTTCEFVSVMFFMSLPASALSLSLLTLERFITLKYPLTHHNILTKKRAIFALVVKWLYVIVVATLPAMGWVYHPTVVIDQECRFYFTIQYAIFMVAVNFILPLLVILFANIEIFRIANRAALKMRKSTKRQEKRRPSLVAIGANVKAAKRIMLLVGLFLLSWLPYIINTIVNMSCDHCYSKLGSWIILTLNFSNAAIDPILYGLLNKDVRHQIRKILREMSFKCTNNRLDKPPQRASRTECLHSAIITTEREMLNTKDTINETTF